MPGPHLSDPELRDYLTVLRRRKGVIVISVVIAVGLALLLSLLQKPRYAATAEVLLQPGRQESLFDPFTGQRADPVRATQTEIRVLESRPVREAVEKELGIAPDVTASPAGQTDVVEVTATSTKPREAAAVANAYATAYIDFRRTQAVDGLVAATEQIQGKITQLQQQIDGLDKQVTDAPAARQDDLRLSLAAQKNSLVEQQTAFKQKLDQLQVDTALASGGAQLVTKAATPTSAVSPRPVRDAVIAGALGLVIGIGLALLLDYLDDSLKSKDELERIAPEIPVIGLIPTVPGWKPSDDPLVVSLTDPRSAAAEAYRTLRTSIQFLALQQPMGIMQVTSASAGEGKTTTLANLGVALADGGHRVTIVCCDLRRPRIHEFFGLDNSTGLTSVLLGTVPLRRAVQAVPDHPRLSLLASGPIPPNPSELLSSVRTVEVLTALQADADMVLIDTPPVLPVTDALVLSGRVDATLLVFVAGSTTRKEATRAVELLEQVDAPLVGTLLNGIKGDAAYGYNYGGYYQYEPSSPPRQSSPKGSGRGGKKPTERVT